MALGMKHWLGLVLTGCTLVAIHELPLTAPPVAVPARSAARIRMETLGAAVRRTAGLYQRLRWADSLSVLVAADARDGVAVGGPPDLGESVLADIRDRVRAEERRVASIDPHVLFGYYVQPRDLSLPPHAGTAPLRGVQGADPETMAGTVDGRPYCVTVAVVDPVMLARGVYARNPPLAPWSEASVFDLLGACRPFVQFGLPGPRVAEWLRRGGIGFAEGDAALPSGGRLRALYARGREAGWRIQWGMPTPNLPLDACLAGRGPACVQLALRSPLDRNDPYAASTDSVAAFIVDRSPFYRVGSSRWSTSLGPVGRYLLGDLERQFGPDAFRRFWTSNEEVPKAFHDAFGMDMGEWLVQWTKANTYTYRAGPSLPRSAALGGFVLLALCGVIAGAWATKRSVA